jgi:UDP-N-acetylglucosamine--N-acetylmuramyl-(pentapeptide) pyrophosphoryl-undecaprenol N-acetylglucosamine transferase
MSWNQQIALSVGGTFGHLKPAIQAASIAKDRFFLIGIGLKESPFLIDSDLQIVSLKGARKFFLLLKSCWDAFIAFQQKNPKIVICFGSFHSFPATIIALLLGKPIWVFEPNAKMGKVNRFFSFFAHKILCYEESLALTFPNRGIVLTPELTTYDSLASFQYFGLTREKKVLLILGGSSGSKFINDFVSEQIRALKDFQIIHFVGPKNDPTIFQKLYQENQIPAYVETFSLELVRAMSIADVAISRAGASSLKELLHYQVPTLIIPFEGADLHQLENGINFLKNGGVGTIVMEEKKGEMLSELFLILQKQRKGANRLQKGLKWSDIISLE